jgi:hypothetical protein
MEWIKNYIDGKRIDSKSGETLWENILRSSVKQSDGFL